MSALLTSIRGMTPRYSQKNPFPRRDIKTCWICQERPADSQEHAFKASRIRELMVNGEPLHVPVDGVVYQVRGPKSKTVKFGKTICQKCNNELTKPFDDAYDYFIAFQYEHFDYFRERDEYQWSEIFDGIDFTQRDLERYYLKNVGCRIVDAGAHVPEEIRTYLFNDWQLPSHSLLFYRNYEVDEAFRLLSTIGGGAQTDFMNTYARVSAVGLDGNAYVSGQPLGYFAAVIQDGPVGVVFQWANPSLEQIPPLTFGIQPNFFMRDREMFQGPIRELLNTWDDYTRGAFLYCDLEKVRVELEELTAQLKDPALQPAEKFSAMYMAQTKQKKVNALLAELQEIYPEVLRLTGRDE